MKKDKIWNVLAGNRDDAASELCRELGILRPTALLLTRRGLFTPDDARSFIGKESVLFHDTALLDGIEEACNRIILALERSEPIVIYGDYDVDGVTSVSTLFLYLRSKGGLVSYYIPNRTGEGYGVNREAIAQLADGGAKLMITVDTGVTAAEEIAYADSLGMDVIVTDHHECHAELPDAVAVINPRKPGSRYPFRELAGVGVVFKLLCALEQRIVGGDYLRTVADAYIDLVALGTVADVMPLLDENRLIVSLGLEKLENTSRRGLRALLDEAGAGSGGRRITASVIGYTVAPRINAAGRISCASRAVELFLTDSDEEARTLAGELCETNRERQAEENAIIEEIRGRFNTDPSLIESPVIVLDEDNWHHGVIGIVASRITESFGKPSLLISFDGDCGKGSGRSVRGLNLVEALAACSDLLVSFGGHELAAGLTVTRDSLPEFKRRINEYAAKCFAEGTVVPTLDIDCELTADDLTLRQADELFLLEPYGVGNPIPLFLLRGATVTSVQSISAGKHTKLTIKSGGIQITAMRFGQGPDDCGLFVGDTADLVFNLTTNEFRGTRSAQLILRDHALSGDTADELAREDHLYREALAGNGTNNLPRRDEFVTVYLGVKKESTADTDSPISLRKLARRFAREGVGAVRLRLILDVFAETGLIHAEVTGADTPEPSYRFIPGELTARVNLESSPLYRRLKASGS